MTEKLLDFGHRRGNCKDIQKTMIITISLTIIIIIIKIYQLRSNEIHFNTILKKMSKHNRHS